MRRWINNWCLKEVRDEILRMEVGKEFQNEVARKTNDFLKEAVLCEGIYKFKGWDLVFNE